MTDDPAAVARTCARLADERKAGQVVLLHVGELAFFTDYFVIATGSNERQIRAIAQQVLEQAEQLGCDLVGVEGEPESGWVLIDLGGTVVHLFDPDARGLYDLELLWGEAPRLEWQAAEPLSGQP